MASTETDKKESEQAESEQAETEEKGTDKLVPMETEEKQETEIEDKKETKDESIGGVPEIKVITNSIVIGLILLVFSATRLPLVTRNVSEWNNREATCNDICEFVPELIANACYTICDNTNQMLAAYAVMETGLAMIIIFTIFGMAKPGVDWDQCNKNKSLCGLFAGLGMVIGGLLYMIGYWIIMDFIINVLKDTDDINHEIFDWWLVVLFFEFWLAGFAAIIFGIDCYYKFLDKKDGRIYSMLSLLILVSLVCFIGYINIAIFEVDFSNDATQIIGEKVKIWETPLIAAGYGVILVSGICFAVFYLIKFESDSLKWINIVCAVLMVIGSLLASIGYWAVFNQYGDSYDHARNSWNTAYNLLLIVLCCFVAWDMVMDDGGDAKKKDKKIYDSVPKEEDPLDNI